MRRHRVAKVLLELTAQKNTEVMTSKAAFFHSGKHQNVLEKKSKTFVFEKGLRVLKKKLQSGETLFSTRND